jgi:tRNA/tmRNA/rRNA uracil-C5-methylase (TrmA/RlmC/RlmD family)
MESSIFCKCNCSGDVYEHQHLYECKKCNAQIWKYSYKREFKEREVKKLFKGETLMLKGFKSNTNSLYDTKAKLIDKKLELIFDNETKPTTLFLCKCGGEVTKISKGYKCNKCEQIIWERFMNKLLTFAQVKRLFKGDELKLENLKSQRGNIFNAEIYYIDKQLNLEYI